MARSCDSSIRLPGAVLLLTVLLLSSAGGSLYAQHLYGTAANRVPGDSIRRRDPDGSNVADIVTGLDSRLQGITIDDDAGKIYWVQRDPLWTRVFRASLDGSDTELILLTPERLGVITIDPTAD